MDQAFAYFDEVAHETDLASRLYQLFQEAITEQIPGMPHAYAPLFSNYRHIYLRPFKYYVAYAVKERTIDIVAVRHGMEDPETAESRLAGRGFE